MNRKIYILFFIFLLLTLRIFAQDYHLSTYYHSPLTLSPAEAGNFDEGYRLTAFRRNQWRSVSTPYQSFALGIDANAPFNINKLGAGLQLVHDVAGEGSFTELYISIPLSYKFILDGNSRNSIRIGLMPSFLQSSIDFGKLNFDSQFQNGQFDPNASNNESFGRDNFWNFSLHAGLLYNRQGRGRNFFTASLGVFNTNRPNQNFISGREELPMRTSVALIANQSLSKSFDLVPTVNFMQQSDNNVFMLGANLRYILNAKPHDNFSFLMGLHWRNADSFVPTVGIEKMNLSLRLSYDVLYSELRTAAAGRGGAEVSLIYLFDKPPPKRMNFQQCPTFI